MAIIPFGMTREEFEIISRRKETYSSVLDRICDEIQQRDLKSMPTKELISLARILGKSLSKLEA